MSDDNKKIEEFNSLGTLRKLQVLGMAERATLDFEQKRAAETLLRLEKGGFVETLIGDDMAVLRFRYKGDYIFSGAALIDGKWVRDNTSYTNLEQGVLSAISVKHGLKGTQYVDFAWSMLKGPRP